MLIETRPGASPRQLDRIRATVEGTGLRTELVAGTLRTLILALPPGADPDADPTREGRSSSSALDPERLRQLAGVARITPFATPAPRVARLEPNQQTCVQVGDGAGQRVGGNALAIIAGPCSVEGEAMLLSTAHSVRAAGAGLLRGGAYKPRTSPYAFQGLGRKALRMLATARADTGLAVVTEVMDPRHAELVAAHADMLQVGARNMQNYTLLREVGMLRRPVLLKRGPSATIHELLLAAEHLVAAGTRDVVLCERGIRTFENATRNTLDVSAVPVLKRETHLPVIVDPSHAGGQAELVAPLALAAVAAGADGLMIEVHPEPAEALSDGDQSLPPEAFAALMRRLAPVAAAVGRVLPADAVGPGSLAREVA
jgi:3-deoxy-7-phosphoheptulonate synthase